MMKKFLSIMLALMLAVQLAACSHSGEPEDTQKKLPAQIAEIVKDKASDYVIVYSAGEENGQKYADRVWQLFSEQFGLALRIRSDETVYEHEILVGNTSRDATASVRQKLSGSGDFAIVLEGDDLVLLATNAAMTERMLVKLSVLLYSGAESGSFVFTDLNNYLYHEDGTAAIGSQCALLQNGGTEFSIVYHDAQNGAREAANYLARQIRSRTGVSFPVRTDETESEYEILIGSGLARAEVRKVSAMLESNRDFLICVSDGKLVIHATDTEYLFLAVLRFLDSFQTGQKELRLSEADNYVYSAFGRDYAPERQMFISEYQKVYNTFSSSFEDSYSTLPISVKSDQNLIEAMVKRMGNSAAVYIGSSSVLYQGFKQKLDTGDYSRTARLRNGHVLIPAEFAERYFGTAPEQDAERYVDLTAVCAQTDGYSLFYDSDTGLAILTPADVVPFTEKGKVNGFSNEQYCARMVAFFTDRTIPEPDNNSEQSRTVIEFSEFVRDAADYRSKIYTACSSPSITAVEENGQTVLYVSYELSQVRYWAELNTVTVIKRSADNGATWAEVGRIDNMRWATAFTLNNEMYLLGNHIHTKSAMIGRVTPQGKVEFNVLMGDVGDSGPTAVLVANGRIYKAYNKRTISAPADADLFDSSVWTVSSSLFDLLHVGWLQKESGTNVSTIVTSECNLMLGPDGGIYNIMRLEDLKAGYAVIVRLSDDGTTYSLLEGRSSLLRNFPTGISKFMIKYDGNTGLYICISNLYTGARQPNQRTVLAISVSADLINWTTKDYLLVERELMNSDVASFAHGWQYADFVIVGNDLHFVVRESTGISSNWHDSNYVTFYTLSDYQSVIGRR